MSCIVCSVPTTSQCSKCHMVRYCGKKHQADDFPRHQELCKEYVAAVKRMKKEEAKLRRGIDDWGNPFEEEVGNFWGIFETRDYMRSVYAVIERLNRFMTTDATTAALDHCMECLRLCRGDNMGIREIVPSFLIRLKKDQECYDFLKWWSTVDDNYDWGDMDLPYLDLKNENRYEPLLKSYTSKYESINFYSAMILIKYRLLHTIWQNVNGYTAFLMGKSLSKYIYIS